MVTEKLTLATSSATWTPIVGSSILITDISEEILVSFGTGAGAVGHTLKKGDTFRCSESIQVRPAKTNRDYTSVTLVVSKGA
jgi:hypothetical protein